MVKDSDFKSRPDVWNDNALWTGNGPNDISSIPTEVQTMYNLSGKVGSENVVKIRNWRIRRADSFHRIYLEFCHQGDLWELVVGTEDINSEYVEGFMMRSINGNENVADRVNLVPEPFIWSAALDLATAGLLMERGTLDSANTNSDPWSLIVHRDLKMSNGTSDSRELTRH